jgi:hypothetical protein
MTRNDLMQKVYDSNHFCSAGDIALALSKRFGRCQGNRKLADGTITKSHIEMGHEFLMQKKKERQQQEDALHKQNFEKSVFFREFCEKAHAFAEKAAKELKEGFHEIVRENIGYSNKSFN